MEPTTESRRRVVLTNRDVALPNQLGGNRGILPLRIGLADADDVLEPRVAYASPPLPVADASEVALTLIDAFEEKLAEWPQLGNEPKLGLVAAAICVLLASDNPNVFKPNSSQVLALLREALGEEASMPFELQVQLAKAAGQVSRPPDQFEAKATGEPLTGRMSSACWTASSACWTASAGQQRRK